jgi:hypothetical protein
MNLFKTEFEIQVLGTGNPSIVIGIDDVEYVNEKFTGKKSYKFDSHISLIEGINSSMSNDQINAVSCPHILKIKLQNSIDPGCYVEVTGIRVEGSSISMFKFQHQTTYYIDDDVEYVDGEKTISPGHYTLSWNGELHLPFTTPFPFGTWLEPNGFNTNINLLDSYLTLTK